jgi:hypothetical protein
VIVVSEGAIVLALLAAWLFSETVRTGQSMTVLFLYCFPSEFLIGLIPHEPVLLLYGALHPPVMVALISTFGTLLAEALNYSFLVFFDDGGAPRPRTEVPDPGVARRCASPGPINSRPPVTCAPTGVPAGIPKKPPLMAASAPMPKQDDVARAGSGGPAFRGTEDGPAAALNDAEHVHGSWTRGDPGTDVRHARRHRIHGHGVRVRQPTLRARRTGGRAGAGGRDDEDRDERSATQERHEPAA